MILQEGKYYRARNNAIYGPLVNDMESAQSFSCPTSGESWDNDGKYYTGSTTSNFDLLAQVEIIVVDPFQAVINQGAPPKVDRVEIASRILPRLAPDLAPTSAAKQALQYADAFIKEIGND